MDVTTFHCPHCQAVLRMRGKQLADSSFHCPDCNQLLQCSQTTDGSAKISVLATPATDKTTPEFSSTIHAWLEKTRSWHKGLTASPVLISWIIAGTGAFLILVLMIKDHNSGDRITTQKQPAKVIETPPSLTDATPIPESSNVQEPPIVIPPALEPQQKAKPVVEAKPEISPAEPILPKADQQLIAVKPDEVPPLEAQKPQIAAALLAPQTDVNMALQIPIVEFRQPKAVPLKKLIRQFEEMLDTQIQVADNVKNDPRLMNMPISFSRKNTTFSILLKQILSKATLTYSVKSNKIYIEKVESL